MIRFILFMTLFFFSGCSIKEYRLFQTKNMDALPATMELNITYSSKIVPNDVLDINIINMNKKSNIMMSEVGISTTTDSKYVVYEDGTIFLPLLNEVKVTGLTIRELNKELTNRYSAYLKSPYIKASITNHRVYVLGEVLQRGVVPIEGETISVIEVIAKSGGLTDDAVRDRIRVISEENGKYVLYTLNLNQFSTLNTRNLMLKHNSIVYVEPKSTKSVRVAINDYLPIVQAISSVLSTFLTVEILNNID